MRVSVTSIIVNLLLAAGKLAAGLIARSSALVSDAADSASDVLSTLVVLLGLRMSGRESDKEHPYGHERIESVAGLVVAAVLAVTGVGIGYAGITRALAGPHETAAVPGVLALVVALASIAIKECMYWLTLSASQKTGSTALKADAWHHRSDALSSVGSFIGVLGARLGLPVLDPIASAVISLFILKTAVDVFREAVGRLTDRACDEGLVAEIRGVILAQAGVNGIDELRTRLFGDRIYVDVEIAADAGESLAVAHETAHRVHDAIETGFPGVKHCMVHVNPSAPS